jgi:hypothetical protein
MKQGQRHSEGTKAKMRIARQRYWSDPVNREKVAASVKRALADPQVRAKMSASIKKAFADPAVRARRSEISKAAWADPEMRARMLAGIRLAWSDPKLRAKMRGTRKYRLPPMTEQQRRVYAKLRMYVGRDKALAQVLGKPMPPPKPRP